MKFTSQLLDSRSDVPEKQAGSPTVMYKMFFSSGLTTVFDDVTSNRIVKIERKAFPQKVVETSQISSILNWLFL
jgi:hypothetical protein